MCLVPNENKLDRIVRLIIGIFALIIGYFMPSGIWQNIVYIIGAIGLFTAFTGFCLLYNIFGISTLKKKK